MAKLTDEERAIRKREGAVARNAYMRSKAAGIYTSQTRLADELGVSQGLVGQWFSGETHIPDPAMLKLGKLLNFDAFSLRPSLNQYREFFEGAGHGMIRIDDLPPEVQATIKTVADAHRQQGGKASNGNG